MQTYNPSVLYPMANGAFIQALGTAYEEMWAGTKRLMRIAPSSLAREAVPFVGEPVRPIKATNAPAPGASVSVNLPAENPEEADDVGLSDAAYFVTHDTYLARISIGRELLEDDTQNLGALMQRVQQATIAAALLPNRLFADMINNNTVNTYDTVTLFNATHTDRSVATPGTPAVGTQSNTQAGTGTTPAAINTDIGTALGNLFNLKAENGEPLNDNSKEFVVFSQPGNLQSLYMALESAFLSSAAAAGPSSNLWAMNRHFSIMPLISGRFSNANHNYSVVNISGVPAAPAICFQRVTPSLEVLGPGSQPWIERNRFIALIRARLSVAPLHWGCFMRVTN